jgi:hypothetical protein
MTPDNLIRLEEFKDLDAQNKYKVIYERLKPIKFQEESFVRLLKIMEAIESYRPVCINIFIFVENNYESEVFLKLPDPYRQSKAISFKVNINDSPVNNDLTIDGFKIIIPEKDELNLALWLDQKVFVTVYDKIVDIVREFIEASKLKKMGR